MTILLDVDGLDNQHTVGLVQDAPKLGLFTASGEHIGASELIEVTESSIFVSLHQHTLPPYPHFSRWWFLLSVGVRPPFWEWWLALPSWRRVWPAGTGPSLLWRRFAMPSLSGGLVLLGLCLLLGMGWPSPLGVGVWPFLLEVGLLASWGCFFSSVVVGPSFLPSMVPIPTWNGRWNFAVKVGPAVWENLSFTWQGFALPPGGGAKLRKAPESPEKKAMKSLEKSLEMAHVFHVIFEHVFVIFMCFSSFFCRPETARKLAEGQKQKIDSRGRIGPTRAQNRPPQPSPVSDPPGHFFLFFFFFLLQVES